MVASNLAWAFCLPSHCYGLKLGPGDLGMEKCPQPRYAVADVVIGENKIDLGRSPAEYFDD